MESWGIRWGTRACEKTCSDGIVRNRTGTIIRLNDVDKKRSRAKIPTNALPSGPGNLRTCARQKIDFLGIEQNRTGTAIGQNDKYWKWSRAKIVTGVLPGESGN